MKQRCCYKDVVATCVVIMLNVVSVMIDRQIFSVSFIFVLQ